MRRRSRRARLSLRSCSREKKGEELGGDIIFLSGPHMEKEIAA